MSLAQIDAPKAQYDSKKKLYLKLAQGQTIIRILEDKAEKFYTHYINNSTVQCLGDDCPVCQGNRVIYTEHPNDFREIKGYSPKVQKFLINVMDRTLVKVCPTCGAENPKAGNAFPVTCSCGVVIAPVTETPSNKIKVLGKGVTVFEQFNAFEETILDAENNPVPLTAFDIVLTVSGAGRLTKVVAIPMTNRMDVLEFNKEDLYDLTDSVPKLTQEEISELQRGISMKDIFSARRATEETNTEGARIVAEATEVSEEEVDEIEAELKAVMEG